MRIVTLGCTLQLCIIDAQSECSKDIPSDWTARTRKVMKPRAQVRHTQATTCNDDTRRQRAAAHAQP